MEGIMMKRVTIEYKDTWIDISVPESAKVIQYDSPDFPKIPVHPDPKVAIKKALENPIQMERIPDLVKKGNKVTIAFDDYFKGPGVVNIIAPIVVQEVLKAGVKKEDITLICANGAHRKFRPSEIMEILGPDLYRQFRPCDWNEGRIFNNDCVVGTVYLGETSLGDEVEYNKAVVETDQLIYIGTVNPIHFGGYSGQGVVIGLSSMRALKSLHSYDTFGSAASRHMDYRPEKNIYRKHKLAVHEKIEEAINKKIFYVDAITNGIRGPAKQIVDIFAGHVPDLEKVEYSEADKYFVVKVPQVDILVVGLPNVLGIDTSNNIGAAWSDLCAILGSWRNKPLLKTNGVLIALGQCTGAISPSRPADPEALRLYRNCFGAKECYDYWDSFCNKQEYIYKYRYEYAYPPIHSLIMVPHFEILRRFAKHIIIAGEVNPGVIRDAGGIPARNFDEALSEAKEIVGNHAEILVLPRYHYDPRMVFEVM
jgi:nickel-dependent lactate racemase